MKRTLNLACGQLDKWGTDRLDKESYGQNGIKIFDLNSGKPLPYHTNTFDEIRFWNVLQIIENPQGLLKECYRILKSGGVFDITTLNSESPYWIFIQPLKDKPVRFGKQYHNNGIILGIFSLYMLENRLRLAGFKIKSSGYIRNNGFKNMIRIKCIK